MVNTSQSSEQWVPAGWTAHLADALAATLREFAPQVRDDEVVLLQVICLPWHGLLSLAMLTAEELAEDATLADPMRTMDWKYGEFTEEVEAWEETTPLAQAMRAAYYSSDDCPAAALAFLRGCAEAAATSRVIEAVRLFRRAEGFRVSVPHPDNRSEFYPPEGSCGAASDSVGQ